MADNDDLIICEILPDGTIKSTNDMISGANHANAEKFIADLARNMGGDTVTKKKGKTGHTHNHDKNHVHEGHSH